MRKFVCVLLVGILLLVGDVAAAKQWVSRDGRFSVEAELLTVDGEQVVLRREDGTVIRVPLERLSLADVKYVQEALQAAGLTPSAAGAAAAGNAPPQETHPEPAPAQKTPVPAGPPLAQPGVSDWQAAPDPPAQGFDLGPDAKVEIALRVDYSSPFVLYPATPSPFVLLAPDENDGDRQLYDLREKKAVGTIEVELGHSDKLALSPDGRYLAYHNYSTRGMVRIWSFAAGEFLKPLDLPNRSSRVGFLGFAGSKRVVVGDASEKAYLVYDVEAGRQCGTIPAEPALDDGGHVLSPAGNYLVVHSLGNRPMAIYDTRNGARAGILEKRTEFFIGPKALMFSPDGRELAAFFPANAGVLIQVWDMADGSTTLTHNLPQDPISQLGILSSRNRPYQWLADRSGWLLSGVAVLDRETGKIVWQDREAINAIDGVLPRQIVDADRMLSFQKGDKTQTLRLVSIPKDAIAKSRDLVVAGGTAADAGLPPLTPVDMKGVQEITLEPASWEYRPAVPALPPDALPQGRIPLGNGFFNDGRTFFSRPDAARVAVGEIINAANAAWKSSSQLPQACHLYDLQSGEQAARFDVPFPTEFIDLSPDGRLGLFRIDRDKDRLDIWDLASGRHVVGFRPFEAEDDRDRKIDWAGFIDENHLIAVSGMGRFVAFKIPECRAVYRSQNAYYHCAGMTRNRRTTVMMSGNTPHFVDALTGSSMGTLPDIESEKIVILPRASFSPDENRLAVISTLDEGCLLVVWDLADRSVLMQSEFPFKTYGLVWCGSNHVLMYRSLGSDKAETLVDVKQGLVVWNYEVQDGSFVFSSPDQRCWFISRDGSGSQRRLAAVELPDREVAARLAELQLPDPLIGPNAAVTLQTRIENPPQAIPPGWANLENLDESLYQHFSRRLQDKGVEVVAHSDARLVVGIKQEKLEETMSVNRLFGPSEKLLISATLLVPYVAVVDSGGNRIWSKLPGRRDMKPGNLDDCPSGMDKETYLRLYQWEQATAWLRSVEIPCPLYHPSVHRGFGESVISPGGTEIRRSPSPTQMKPQHKTANVQRGGSNPAS